MRRLPIQVALTCLVALLAGLHPAAAKSPTIETTFHNSIDIAGFRDCAWREGRPAPNRQVEETIRSQVELQLEAKGYRLVTEGAGCLVMTQAVRDRHLPVGMLVVDIYDKMTGDLAWRGLATGMTKSDPKQIQKLVDKTVKKMFKQFPGARAAQP